MPFRVRGLNIDSIERSVREMRLAGVDPAGIDIMAPKQAHYNLRVSGLSCTQANVVKQEALSIGAEAAVARGVVSCSIAKTDAILSGTLRQFSTLIAKLRMQTHGLGALASSLERALRNLGARPSSVSGVSRSWSFDKGPLLMGILNVTPDSFFDGGKAATVQDAITRGLRLFEDGAHIVDVGGESTRPGAVPIGEEEELRRAIPVVEGLCRRNVPVSIDTSKARVAKEALSAGAEVVNDVSALSDPLMCEAVSKSGAVIIIMHRRAAPAVMQDDTVYRDLVGEVYDYLCERVEYATSCGIGSNRIIIDPGLGFGKSRDGNFELIRNLGEFATLGLPVMVGHSRKSFTGSGNSAPDDRILGTHAVTTAAVINGAHVLRVHDVLEARGIVETALELRRARPL